MECSAALRTEFLVGSSPDAPAQTALLHVKSNLGPLAPPLDYRIGEDGNFHWTGLSNLTPEDLLAARPTGAGLPKPSLPPNGCATACNLAARPRAPSR